MDDMSSLVFDALSTPSAEPSPITTNNQAFDQLEASFTQPAVTEPTMPTTSPTPGLGTKRKKAKDAPKQTRRKRNEPEPEWSELVREKQHKEQAKSTRCRQACDRCKMRKARCDPGGDQADGACLSCYVEGIACKVTDRVTNETFVRGEAGMLRRELAAVQEELDQTAQQLDNALKSSQRLQEENSSLLFEVHRLNQLWASSESFPGGFNRAAFPHLSLGTDPFNNPQ
ncbi:hypothetical protein N7493_010610 [Penicillium malachiteum]|uniref:Zn(2)-C6 fungal-type domain-containing protein n=1 Tax=Penicillium malachiteum TaxID=1324776 RepID=A0AAD6HD51_9EURO|nr:hypothetical protein N7493_010610 [Penicillium malachiteum]